MTSKTLLAAVTSAFLLGACATGGDSFGGLGSGTGYRQQRSENGGRQPMPYRIKQT